MAHVLAPKDQWYVVHVLSGQENKVRDNLEKRVKKEEMSDVVFEVLVPTERVSEIKRGKKSETTRKFFPGYLIVNMHLLDEENQLVGRTWYFIRETPGVIGFAGTKDRPIPMRQSEVENMLAQMREREEKVKPKVSFEVGETVKVADGPLRCSSPRDPWARILPVLSTTQRSQKSIVRAALSRRTEPGTTLAPTLNPTFSTNVGSLAVFAASSAGVRK